MSAIVRNFMNAAILTFELTGVLDYELTVSAFRSQSTEAN